ncbi:MAG: MFS transporter [Anaerolineae bacterium]|nr:MFS transporter [Anaerolineae bacterium]
MREQVRRYLHNWWGLVDPYVIRGTEKRFRPGMIRFWWYGFFLSASGAFIGSYLTLYMLALGATNMQIGALSSLTSLFGMIMPIPGAQWATRIGSQKRIVFITYSLRYIAVFCLLLVPFITSGPAAVYWAMGLLAVRAAFINLGNASWTAFAGDIIPPDRRGRFFSARKTVMSLATFVFVPLAGYLIEAFSEPLGYQVSFLIAVVFGGIAQSFYSQIPELSRGTKQKKRQVSSSIWKSFTNNRTFLIFTLVSMFFNFAWQLAGPYFGVYEVKVLGATPRIVGILSMASSIFRMLGQQIWGRLVDRRGARWAFVICLLFIPVIPFIWLPLTNPWQLIFVVLPSGFLWAGREIANFNLLLELPSKADRVQAIATYNTLIGLANILGPLVGGQVVENLGYKWLFAMSGLGRLIAAGLFVVHLRPFKKKSRSLV